MQVQEQGRTGNALRLIDTVWVSGKHDMIYDVLSVNSSFLIKNIDLAFMAWEKPWARDVPFEVFCAYILPYRVQTEQISFLREEMMKRFLPLLDSAGVKTPLEACVALNEHLKSVVRYQDTGLPFYPTIEETYQSGISRCDGICNLGTFIMRAIGIPVAVDFTIWPKMDLGHSWCAVWNDGRFYSFGPGEDQPEVHARMFLKTAQKACQGLPLPIQSFALRQDFFDRRLSDIPQYSFMA